MSLDSHAPDRDDPLNPASQGPPRPVLRLLGVTLLAATILAALITTFRIVVAPQWPNDDVLTTLAFLHVGAALVAGVMIWRGNRRKPADGERPGHAGPTGSAGEPASGFAVSEDLLHRLPSHVADGLRVLMRPPSIWQRISGAACIIVIFLFRNEFDPGFRGGMRMLEYVLQIAIALFLSGVGCLLAYRDVLTRLFSFDDLQTPGVSLLGGAAIAYIALSLAAAGRLFSNSLLDLLAALAAIPGGAGLFLLLAANLAEARPHTEPDYDLELDDE